ncbi:class II fumarate hydratase [Ketobacter sp. MCCC 1A13808]|uniref:class II fumarate hydratase n=1 Tax=Ketobacter sp. MCCC 1A13808 TaxID=2602738 RepID=UPI000F1E3C58|nr:class II fumarate hydratase [Ketobacter sp. MCCC 1A13808]MVF14189.1 class II fumarate hydratase [Ketobacter sp. MCCC 1A13808]RLP54095.1 MAG: class II fumarate hydratase [Ketobacter sp.]
MTNTRIERDSMGDLDVAEDALYAAQTQRAINNFPVSGLRLPEKFIRSLLLIKSAAADVNVELEQIPESIGVAIKLAVKKLLDDPALMSHFPVDVFQTGSGTSSNMNANEVLATLASNISGEKVGANDHINCGQSSNDIIPTTIHVSAALALQEDLLPALHHLVTITRKKAVSVDHYIKTGRTHLMDAMPVRLSQSLNGWADQIEQNIQRLAAMQPDLQSLAQGGTAVGTGINAHPDFATKFNRTLSSLTDLQFTPAENFFTHIGSQDIAVALSGQLKATAVSIIKIANDLRWMNSGPLAGLGEIELEALQPGSSIMPGKVNPVIPEAAAMVGAQVIGNDAAITVAGQSGNFELNVMLPLVAHNLLSSIEILANVSVLLADKAIASFNVNEAKLADALTRNPILVTALNPIIGYEKAAKIAKQAYAEGRPIIDVAEENTDIGRDELTRLLNPEKLTLGGV